MRLFLECKPDETLALAVGVRRADIVHSHGKGRIAKELSRNTGIIGMVDEDPGSAEPSTLARFVEMTSASAHDVKFKEDGVGNNRLIVICPRLEPWLIKTSKMANLKMEDYSLGVSLKELDEVINFRLPNVQRLLNELLASNSPRLLHLKSLLAG